MNAESRILSQLDTHAESVYWNYTKFMQRFALHCFFSIVVGLLMIIFLPLSPNTEMAILTLTVSYHVGGYWRFTKSSIQNQNRLVMKEWEPIRKKITALPDFETLEVLVKFGYAKDSDITNHPKFTAVKNYYNFLCRTTVSYGMFHA